MGRRWTTRCQSALCYWLHFRDCRLKFLQCIANSDWIVIYRLRDRAPEWGSRAPKSETEHKREQGAPSPNRRISQDQKHNPISQHNNLLLTLLPQRKNTAHGVSYSTHNSEYLLNGEHKMHPQHTKARPLHMTTKFTPLNPVTIQGLPHHSISAWMSET